MVQSSSDSFVLECPAKYKIDYCESLDCGNIYLHDEHSHDLGGEYENKNGIADEIKSAIRTILEHNPSLYPKKVRIEDQLKNQLRKP